MEICEFLQRYGRDLFRATEAKLPPLVQEPRLTWQGGRKPMGAQALAITGIAEALRRHGVGGLAFYRKGAPEEAIDALEEAFLDIEDALDVGVAVILVPREREA